MGDPGPGRQPAPTPPAAPQAQGSPASAASPGYFPRRGARPLARRPARGAVPLQLWAATPSWGGAGRQPDAVCLLPWPGRHMPRSLRCFSGYKSHNTNMVVRKVSFCILDYFLPVNSKTHHEWDGGTYF